MAHLSSIANRLDSASKDASSDGSSSSRIHLPFLDGIRGLCALYVVMFHLYFELTTYQKQHLGPSRLIYVMQSLFGWGGHDCVTVFICLSGFSLTIPLARSGYKNLQLKADLKRYFARRFLRLAPPYFATIFLILLAACIFPGVSSEVSTPWKNALPLLDLNSVLTHLAFIHNLWSAHLFRISPQFWSIATEAQIYVVLPLLIVPIARIVSIGWSLIGTLIAAILVILFFPSADACLHYIFTFGLGAFVADRVFANPSGKTKHLRLEQILLSCLFVSALWIADIRHNALAIRDILVSPLCATGIFLLSTKGEQSRFIAHTQGFLASPVIAFLGKISYSLYLVHYIVIAILHDAMVRMGLSIHVVVVGLIVVAPLLSIFIAWLMHHCFEVPSMRFASRIRSTPKPAIA